MRAAWVAMAVLAAGCGAPGDGRYVGRLVGEAPQPCPDGTAVLLLRGDEARFIPNEGVVVLDGKVGPDGAVAAAAERAGARSERGGAPRAPFRMVFQGRLENGRVTGTYGTPLCRGHVELAPG